MVGLDRGRGGGGHHSDVVTRKSSCCLLFVFAFALLVRSFMCCAMFIRCCSPAGCDSGRRLFLPLRHFAQKPSVELRGSR